MLAVTEGSICANLKNGQKCVCHRRCPKHWKPVCGTDLVTYGNRCHLKKVQCKQNLQKIGVKSPGICRNDEEFVKASSYLNSVLNLWDEELDSNNCTESEIKGTKQILLLELLETSSRSSNNFLSKIWFHFLRADKNRNMKVSRNELWNYLRKSSNKLNPFRACLDALLYLPSRDHNWGELEITFSEFYKMIFQGE